MVNNYQSPHTAATLSILYLCKQNRYLISENYQIPGTSLEKAMAPQSSNLAWKIPWTEEPGRLQSTGSQRVGTQLSDLTFTFTFTFPLFSARMSIVIFPVYSTPLYVAYIGLCSQILGLRGTIHKKLNPRGFICT